MTAEEVIEGIMKRKIDWYDYHELTPPLQKAYYGQAQQILRSDVWQNEFRHLIADWMKFVFHEAKDWESVMGMRMSANALELMQQRLESIENPEQQDQTVEQVNEAV